MAGSTQRSKAVLLLALLLKAPLEARSARFVVNGPILTLTLKDPSQEAATKADPPSAADLVELLERQQLQSSAASTSAAADGSHSSSQPLSVPWLDLSSLRPNLIWDVSSLAPPLPYWFPNLKQLKARIGYQYDAPEPFPSSTNDANPLRRYLPTWIEGTAKMATQLGELIVQPSYEVRSQRTAIVLEASRGAHWALAKFGLARPSQIVPHLEAVRGSFALNLPYVSVSQVRITPSLEMEGRPPHQPHQLPQRGDWACQIEAITGGYGRTRAVLNLEWNAPTLSVIHQLDSRNTIAPTINLYNARIVYQWNCLLGRSGMSSVRTRVDPTSAIDITWTDHSEGGGGSWVTDVKLPLEATTLQKLAADIRIRRQFRF
jgi:hypothetical protein